MGKQPCHSTAARPFSVTDHRALGGTTLINKSASIFHSIHKQATRGVAALFCAMALLSLSPVAAAQEDPIDIEKTLKKTALSKLKQNEEDKQVRPPNESRVQLGVQWGLRRGASHAEDKDKLVGAYRRLQNKLAIDNDFQAATVLLREAEDAAKNNNPELATKRLQQAETLAPALPHVELARAALLLETDPASAMRLRDYWADAYEKGWSFGATRMTIGASAIDGAAQVVWMIAVLVFLLVLFRHMPLVVADLKRLLPKGAEGPQLSVGLGLIVTVATIATGSWLAGALVVVALLGLYLSWAERLTLVTLLAALGFMPAAAELADAGYEYQDSVQQKFELWALQGCDEACVKELKSIEPADPRGLWARDFLIATSNLRRGVDAKGTLDTYGRLEASAPNPELKVAVVNNKGIALYLLQKEDQAVAAFEEAAKLAPNHFGPQVNLVRGYEIVKRDADADAAVARAVDLGGDEAVTRTSERERSLNLWFHSHSLQTEMLLEWFADDYKASGITLARWKRYIGALPDGIYMPLGYGGAAFLLLLWPLALALRISRRCPRCGGAMHKGESGPDTIQGEVCHACLMVFTGGKMGYHEKVRHERQIEGWEVRSKWFFRIGNLLFPGGGTAVRGVSVGLFLFPIVAAGIALLRVGEGPVRDPFQLGTFWNDGRFIIAVAAVAFAYLTSFVLLFMGDQTDPEEIEIDGPKGGNSGAARERMTMPPGEGLGDDMGAGGDPFADDGGMY